MSLREKPTVGTNTGVHNFMSGHTTSVEGVMTEFPTPILPKIAREPTREALIELNRLLSSNAASVTYNLRGGIYAHLELAMAVDYYLIHMGHDFVLPHNTGN